MCVDCSMYIASCMPVPLVYGGQHRSVMIGYIFKHSIAIILIGMFQNDGKCKIDMEMFVSDTVTPLVRYVLAWVSVLLIILWKLIY